MTPSTTRSQAAANSVLARLEPSFAAMTNRDDEISSVIASHYAELEAAAVLARDALEWYQHLAPTVAGEAALAALGAALSITPRINTNVERTDS